MSNLQDCLHSCKSSDRCPKHKHNFYVTLSSEGCQKSLMSFSRLKLAKRRQRYACYLSSASLFLPLSPSNVSQLSGQSGEPLWFCPLCKWNSVVIYPRLDWLVSVTTLPCCQVAEVNERPPSRCFVDKTAAGILQSLASQTWGEDGIYGMACQVGISVGLYKTKASHATYLTLPQTLQRVQEHQTAREVTLSHKDCQEVKCGCASVDKSIAFFCQLAKVPWHKNSKLVNIVWTEYT